MEGSQVEGIIIIKAQLGDDIRCIPVHNVDITFDELVLMMQRIFKGQLSADDEITIKYKDHDGDLVTIVDGNDLTFALQLSHLLRITIFPNQQITPLANKEVKTLRRELQQVRDMVVKMLDRLELRGARGSAVAASAPLQQNGNAAAANDDSDSDGQSTSGPSSKVLEERPSAREFDPLHQAAATAPPSRPEDQNIHAQSVPSSTGHVDGGQWGGATYGAPPQQAYQQQPTPQQQKPVQQAPPSQPPPPPSQPGAPVGYYPSMPGQQVQGPPPQAQPYYQTGYQQQAMTAQPPPAPGAPVASPYAQPGQYPPPPPMAGGQAGYPGPQPTPPPMGVPGVPPPPAFGAPPMMGMQGQPPRGGINSYGRPYQPAYQ